MSVTKLSAENAEIIEEIRKWSGSAFLAGEEVSRDEEAFCKSEIYSLLCKLPGYLAMQAAQPTAGDDEVERVALAIYDATFNEGEGVPPFYGQHGQTQQHYRKLARAALSAMKGDRWREAFQLLADLNDALTLTAEYSPEATVGSLVESSAEFGRASDFLRAALPTPPSVPKE